MVHTSIFYDGDLISMTSDACSLARSNSQCLRSKLSARPFIWGLERASLASPFFEIELVLRRVKLNDELVVVLDR